MDELKSNENFYISEDRYTKQALQFLALKMPCKDREIMLLDLDFIQRYLNAIDKIIIINAQTDFKDTFITLTDEIGAQTFKAEKYAFRDYLEKNLLMKEYREHLFASKQLCDKYPDIKF